MAMKVDELVADRVSAIRERRMREGLEAVGVTVGLLGITQVELSAALGLYTPPPGTSGLSTVNAWVHREKNISAKNMVILRAIREGTIRFRLTGRVGRRDIYEMALDPCPDCGAPLRAESQSPRSTEGWDSCGAHRHEIKCDGLLTVRNCQIEQAVIEWLPVARSLPRDVMGYLMDQESRHIAACSPDRVELWLGPGDAVPSEIRDSIRKASREHFKDRGRPAVYVRRNTIVGMVPNRFVGYL